MKYTVYTLFIILAAVFTLTSYAGASDYVGVKKCKMCHIKQYKSWKETGMADSFENLKPGVKGDEKKKAGIDPDKDYTHDCNCLGCHTTGYGKPGGFKSIEETPELAGVQCEGCHGPGADFRKVMTDKHFKHAEAASAGLMVPSEEANNCSDCHNEESPFNEKVDPKYKFVFSERVKQTHKHFPLKYEH